MPVKLDLEKHERITKDFAAFCRERDWIFVSTEYHRTWDTVAWKTLGAIYTMGGLSIRDAPDGVLLAQRVAGAVGSGDRGRSVRSRQAADNSDGSDAKRPEMPLAIRVELKSVSADGKLRLPLFPYWRACRDAEVGDPVLYVVGGGSGFLGIRAGFAFPDGPATSGSITFAACCTTDRWSDEHEILARRMADDLGVLKFRVYPWNYQYSGDPWLEMGKRQVASLPSFESTVAQLALEQRDLRAGK